MIALSANESVFSLVLVAWSGLGASFVPIVLTAGLGLTVTSEIAVIAGMLAGFSTVVMWRWFELNYITYEVLPGIACGCLALVLCELFSKKTRSGNKRRNQSREDDVFPGYSKIRAKSPLKITRETSLRRKTPPQMHSAKTVPCRS